MAKVILTTGDNCYSPTTGATTGFEIQYNTDHISVLFKKDIQSNKNNEWMTEYCVVAVFNNSNTTFKFLDSGDRDSWYNKLKV